MPSLSVRFKIEIGVVAPAHEAAGRYPMLIANRTSSQFFPNTVQSMRGTNRAFSIPRVSSLMDLFGSASRVRVGKSNSVANTAATCMVLDPAMTCLAADHTEGFSPVCRDAMTRSRNDAGTGLALLERSRGASTACIG